jgi:hypothetical protein
MGRAGKKKGKERERVWRVFFFFFFFQTHFKPISNPFKFKTFPQIFTIIFKNFHKYFKTFKTTPQPKLMHSNHDAQALIASKLLK